MKTELTITEIAARLEVSERTALRRISDGKLLAKKLGPNRYLVSSEDIDNLAPRAKLTTLAKQVQELENVVSGQSVRSSPVSKEQITELAAELSHQGEIIEALKQELEALRDRVAVLEQATRKNRPAQRFVVEDVNYNVPRAQPAPTEPSTTITARSFAERHKLGRDAMAGWIKRGQIASTSVPYGGRTQHVLTLDQQRTAIEFWQHNHVPYTRCSDCPHDQHNELRPDRG